MAACSTCGLSVSATAAFCPVCGEWATTAPGRRTATGTSFVAGLASPQTDHSPSAPGEWAGAPALNVTGLASAYRHLVRWFGVQLLLNLAYRVVLARGGSAVLPMRLVIAAGLILTIVALAYYGYRTARELVLSVPELWGLAICIPLLNVISLVTLSFKAKRVCGRYGIRVGLLGPKV